MRVIIKRSVIVFAVFLIAAVCFYEFYMLPRYTVPILMYHGVADVKGDMLFVTPRNFERQMNFLHANNYKVMSMDEYVDGVNTRKTFSRKSVVITFDDGYADNFINAFPVLSKYKMPAVIFLITNYVSRDKEYLTWDQVNFMAKNNIVFGGHTRNHIHLPSVSDPMILENEIAGARSDIEKETGKASDYFCYPYGGFDNRIEFYVKNAGYKGACITNRGKDRSNRNVYQLNRVKITNFDVNRPFYLRIKLSGYFNLFRRIKDDGYCQKFHESKGASHTN